jgi:hypothetical protein
MLLLLINKGYVPAREDALSTVSFYLLAKRVLIRTYAIPPETQQQ